MRAMLAEGRIRPIEIEKDVRVHTAWDLGVSDSTAIWFVQCVGRERWLVDYYEGSGVGLVTRDVDRICEFIDKWDVPGRGVYYCVSTILEGKRRTIETAHELKFIFVDIDYKDVVESPKEIDRIIAELLCKPSRIHRTGNGLHLLWDLDKPLTDTNKARKILRAVCRVMGADPHVCHPAAYMRMPGTHNSKFSQWTLVKASMPSDLFYNISQIESAFDPRTNTRLFLTRKDRDDLNPFLAFAKDMGFSPPIDVEARLKAMQFGGGGDKGIHTTQIAVEAGTPTPSPNAYGRPRARL
jgi:hypothetical protein